MGSVRKVESEEARVLDQREIERGEGELRIKKKGSDQKTVTNP